LTLLFNRVSSRAREPETRSTVYGFLQGGGPNEMIASGPNQSIEIKEIPEKGKDENSRVFTGDLNGGPGWT